MKPVSRKILLPADESFTAGEYHRKYFNVPWHTHPEYELLIVLNSKGKRYVGDCVEDFTINDMVLVGPNLPHCWLNEKLSECTGKDFKVHYLILHFKHDFLGPDFINSPELKDVATFLSKAKRGVEFKGAIIQSSINTLRKIIKANSLDKLILFLELLKGFANYKDIKLLSSDGFTGIRSHSSSEMEKVLQYITENMKGKIQLKKAAELINMSVSGFCKYFKKQMKQSFISYVNNFRIGYACSLIKDTDMQITEICYESGFDNYSNFFRQFKKYKGMSPESYKRISD